MSLLALPEELLERILVLCVVANPECSPPRSWHTPTPARRAAAILLVNKTFLRIATPLLYRTLILRSPEQLTLLLNNAFKPNPELAAHVRTVVLSGGYEGFDEFVNLCRQLEVLDITLDNNPWDESMQLRFGDSLQTMGNIKHLVLRKDAYLTQEKPKFIISQLAKAVPNWRSLETLDIRFRLSSDPVTCAFAIALASAPNLKSIRALLPAVWNTTFLTISQNPRLERIHLSSDHELIGSQLFLNIARRHSRLMDLVKAGTPIMRARAQSSPTAKPPSLPIPIKVSSPIGPIPSPPSIIVRS